MGAGTPKEPQIGAMEPRAQGHGRCHLSNMSCRTMVCVYKQPYQQPQWALGPVGFQVHLVSKGEREGMKGLLGSALGQGAKSKLHLDQSEVFGLVFPG